MKELGVINFHEYCYFHFDFFSFVTVFPVHASISAKSLKSNMDITAITKLTNDYLGKSIGKVFECIESEAGHSAFFKNLLKEDDVVQMQNLAITNLPNFKDQKVKCTTVDVENRDVYVYLGSAIGTYHLDKEFSIKDPHFYVLQRHTHYNIDAIGKFYPCPKEGKDENNAVFHSLKGKTIVKVQKNIQFRPWWGEKTLDDNEDPISDYWIHAIDPLVHMSDETTWITILEGPTKFHTNVLDNNMTLRKNPGSRPHNATGLWVVEKNEWNVKFNIGNLKQWRPFVEDFFPKRMPMQGFEIEKLGRALPTIIDGDLKVSI